MSKILAAVLAALMGISGVTGVSNNDITVPTEVQQVSVEVVDVEDVEETPVEIPTEEDQAEKAAADASATIREEVEAVPGTPPPTPETVTTPAAVQAAIPFSQADIEAVAKTVWREGGAIPDKKQVAAIVWCILNRYDSDLFPDTLIGVVAQPYQFMGYHPEDVAREDMIAITIDVMQRWAAEKAGETNVGRVLPKEYIGFYGDGMRNHFIQQWPIAGEWNWSLPDPYI